MESVDFMQTTLQKWRQAGDSDDNNDTQDECMGGRRRPACGVYSVASRLGQSVDVAMTMPRLAGRQTCRNNVVTSTPSDG